MRSMRLFAISIDEVRDVFRATPELAERLRTIAQEQFPAPRPRRVGLFRRDPAIEVDPSRPTPADADALLSGSYVAPERLRASWRLLAAWLGHLASSVTEVSIGDLDDTDFELARAGLPSDYALRNLGRRDLGIPLRPLPGQVNGYAKHVQAVETGAALARVADTAQDEFTVLLKGLQPVRDVLAAVAADDRLDLVVVQTDQV